MVQLVFFCLFMGNWNFVPVNALEAEADAVNQLTTDDLAGKVIPILNDLHDYAIWLSILSYFMYSLLC